MTAVPFIVFEWLSHRTEKEAMKCDLGDITALKSKRKRKKKCFLVIFSRQVVTRHLNRVLYLFINIVPVISYSMIYR